MSPVATVSTCAGVLSAALLSVRYDPLLFFAGVGENRSPYGLSCLQSSLTCGIKRDTYDRCFQGAQNRANADPI